jgi:hypothetical protein
MMTELSSTGSWTMRQRLHLYQQLCHMTHSVAGTGSRDTVRRSWVEPSITCRQYLDTLRGEARDLIDKCFSICSSNSGLYNESVATLTGYVALNIRLTVSKTARAACNPDCDVAAASSVETRAEESRSGWSLFIVMSSPYIPFGWFVVLHAISAVSADRISCVVWVVAASPYKYVAAVLSSSGSKHCLAQLA